MLYRPLSWGGTWAAPQCPQVAARGHSALGPRVLRARVAGVSVCIRVHACVHVLACMCVHMCLCVHVLACTCVCVWVHIYVHMCLCVNELERTGGQILWWVTWKHGSLKTHSFSFSEPVTENRQHLGQRLRWWWTFRVDNGGALRGECIVESSVDVTPQAQKRKQASAVQTHCCQVQGGS